MAQDTVQQIKEKLTITEVVGPYVKLTRAGKYMRGLSPFNKEKTPSFYVNEERSSYYCFSSNQGGDMFTFIQTMEGVDFKGALKILAEKAGVEIVYERGAGAGSREQKDKLDRLREAMARAEQSYKRALDVDGAPYTYAVSRGLKPETIKEWNLGFAPDNWRTLLEELAAAGFKNDELLGAGLIKEADGKPGTYYDRFRNRLMFPIKDSAGRTVAFTGRALDPNDQAKYLNSPETELYKKSEILFGMDKAKDAIRQRGFVMLVEGQMDLLHAHQAGFTNAVALSGTALTTTHINLMKRYSENLMLALDGDRAGLAATQKHAITALRAGMRVKAVKLPKGKDPADVIQEDAKDFAKRVQDAQPVVEFFLAVLAEGSDTHRMILAAERIILPLIVVVQSPIEREHFINVTARSLGITPEAVRASASKARVPDAPEGKVTPYTNSTAPVPKQTPREFREQTLRAVAKNYAGTPLAERISVEYNRIKGSPLMEDDVPERALFEVGLTYGEHPESGAADDLISAFEKAVLTEKREELAARLRRAESVKDMTEVQEASREYMDISRKIAGL
jgi:DNA primase